MSRGIDPQCYLLAEHFLSDVPQATLSDIKELAGDIQQLCEDFCRTFEDGAA